MDSQVYTGLYYFILTHIVDVDTEGGTGIECQQQSIDN